MNKNKKLQKARLLKNEKKEGLTKKAFPKSSK